MDWENWCALELDSKPSNDLKLFPQLYSYYHKTLFDRNVTVDFAHPESDLAGYKLVIAPNLYLVRDNSAYVGTVLEQSGMQWLPEYICQSVGVQSVAAIAPAGVEILQRTNGKSRFLFVLNHSNQKVNVAVEGQGCDLLTGNDINGSVELKASGVAAIQMK